MSAPAEGWRPGFLSANSDSYIQSKPYDTNGDKYQGENPRSIWGSNSYSHRPTKEGTFWEAFWGGILGSEDLSWVDSFDG